jgi:hypothetical protein
MPENSPSKVAAARPAVQPFHLGGDRGQRRVMGLRRAVATNLNNLPNLNGWGT